MPYVPGLRSPHAIVGRIVYFGRMLDKIRLQRSGRLPEEFLGNLGDSKPLVMDALCCRFLGVSYSQVEALVGSGADEEVLSAVEGLAGRPSDEACAIWNRYMVKLGWRDDRTERLKVRLRECGLEGSGVETFFELLDADEGRLAQIGKPWHPTPFHTVVVMGVAGSGKSTIGSALARELGWEFVEGDHFHPKANVEKLSQGSPLTDADREPWLRALKDELENRSHAGRKTVLACSALKQRYRDLLAPDLAFTRFIHLKASGELLAERIKARRDHFMPPALLPSQLATLEPPESALQVDVSLPVAEACAFIRAKLHV